MLKAVDEALQALFLTQMRTLASPPAPVVASQVGVAPPDEDWLADVTTGTPRRAINIFLVDLRERRELRSNQRIERGRVGEFTTEPAPMRVAAYYLITAWSPSADRLTRTIDEHEMLADAARVLADAEAITVDGVELPTQIMPPEGFPKLAELWGTMGSGHRWKPAIEVVVTIALERTATDAGQAVTTRFATHHVLDAPAGQARESMIQIGGIVTNAAGAPVARAWVRIEQGGAPLQVTRSNAGGEFDFLPVEPGIYELRARADGHSEVRVQNVTVPSPTGRYDIAFT